MMLNEGGKAFPDVVPFDHKIIKKIQKPIDSVLKSVGAESRAIGSGATPTPGKMSGDLDVIVDADKIQGHFNSADIPTARKDLRSLFDKAGLQTTQSGNSVHVRVPIGKEAHQVDIMIVPNAETAAGFHTHEIPKDSPYKGKHKQIAVAYLAKNHPKSFKWSPYKGLVDRQSDELVSNNLDEIAKILIGPKATAKALGSVESIAKALGKERGDKMMADLTSDKGFNPPPKESLADRQLRRIKELLPK